MEIKLNGNIIDVKENISVGELVSQTEFAGKPLVVQVNAKIIEFNNYDRIINQGDNVKIFNFVGGG